LSFDGHSIDIWGLGLVVWTLNLPVHYNVVKGNLFNFVYCRYLSRQGPQTPEGACVDKNIFLFPYSTMLYSPISLFPYFLISLFPYFLISLFLHFSISPFLHFSISPFLHFSISLFLYFSISLFSLFPYFPISTIFPYLCPGDNLFYRIPACPRVRKVRTTQSTILPNGKVLRLNTVGTASATENIPPRFIGARVKTRGKSPRDVAAMQCEGKPYGLKDQIYRE